MNGKKAKPSDFIEFPYGSVKQKCELEQVTVNIMVILKRTGDEWRDLPWEEYKAERLKDGNFTGREKNYFEQVKKYAKSALTAALFCPGWAKIYEDLK